MGACKVRFHSSLLFTRFHPLFCTTVAHRIAHLKRTLYFCSMSEMLQFPQEDPDLQRGPFREHGGVWF